MIESLILNAVIAKKDYSILVKYNIDSERFFREQSQAFNYIRSHLQEFGEVPSLESVAMKCPQFEVLSVTESLDTLAKKLIEKTLKSEQKELLSNLAKSFGELDAYQIMEQMTRKLEDWQQRAFKRSNQGINWSENGEERFQEYKSRQSKDFGKKIPLPLAELNEASGGGAERGEVVVICAGTGIGKSWMGLLSGLVANNQGFRILYESAETSDTECMFRLDTLEGGFNNRGLWQGQLGLSESEYLEFTKKFNRDSNRPPFIIKTPRDWMDGLTLNQLEYDIKQTNADLVVIDHFMLMNFKGKSHEDKSAGSRALKQLAAKLGVVMVLLYQASGSYIKESQKESSAIRELSPPRVKDYSETIAVIQDADKFMGLDAVTFVDPETKRKRGKAKIVVDKDRSGGLQGLELELIWMPNDGVISTRKPVDLF